MTFNTTTMAEGKKSFILYADQIDLVEMLPDDKAGELFKHIMRYVNDLNPETDDLTIKLAFEPIKKQLKRDLNRYEEKREERSRSGKIGNLKRYHNDLFELYEGGKKTLEQCLAIAETRKTSHSDEERSLSVAKLADNDNVNVNVNDNDTITPPTPSRGKRFKPPTLKEVSEYCKERKNSVNPITFFNFYESKGWMVGKSRMKNWKSAILNWEQRSKESSESNKQRKRLD